MAQQAQERPIHALEPRIIEILAGHGIGYRPRFHARPASDVASPGSTYMRIIAARGEMLGCWGPQALAEDYTPSQAELEAGSQELSWVVEVIDSATKNCSDTGFNRLANSRTIAVLSWLKRNSRRTAPPAEIGEAIDALIGAQSHARLDDNVKAVLGGFTYRNYGTVPEKVERQARELASRLNSASPKKKPLIILEKDEDRPENSAAVKEWDLPPVDALLPEELGLALPAPPIPAGSADDSVIGMLRQVLANQELIIAGLGLHR